MQQKPLALVIISENNWRVVLKATSAGIKVLYQAVFIPTSVQYIGIEKFYPTQEDAVLNEANSKGISFTSYKPIFQFSNFDVNLIFNYATDKNFETSATAAEFTTAVTAAVNRQPQSSSVAMLSQRLKSIIIANAPPMLKSMSGFAAKINSIRDLFATASLEYGVYPGSFSFFATRSREQTKASIVFASTDLQSIKSEYKGIIAKIPKEYLAVPQENKK